MAEAPRYVVDASVAVKWHLHDETQRPQALAVLRDYQEGRISLLAPEHIRYEVAHAIRRAVTRRRVAPFLGREAIISFLSLKISAVRSA